MYDKFDPKKHQVSGTHYQNMAIQPSEFIVKNDLNWYEGNAVKYICRHHMKNGKQDLEKAIHYLQLAIDHYYPEVEKEEILTHKFIGNKIHLPAYVRPYRWNELKGCHEEDV